MTPALPSLDSAVTTLPTRTPRPSFLFRLLASKNLFPALLTLVYLLIAIPALINHPIWRDEGQAFLLARDSPTPWAVLHNMRYEGHPPLWHLLLWVLTRFTSAPEAMQCFHLLLAAASVFIVARFAPFPRPILVAYALSYFPLFEYGILARNYQFILLFTILLLAVWTHRRFAFIWYGILISLLCLSHALGMIIAFPLGLMLLADALFTPAGWEYLETHWTKWIRLALFVLISGMGAGLAAWQTIPPPDAAYASGYDKEINFEKIQQYSAAIWDSYIPVPPNNTPFFWNKNILRDKNFFSYWKITDVEEFRWHATLWLVAGALIAICFSWRAILVYVLATGGIVAFLMIKLRGSTHLRHEGAEFVVLLAALWIAWNPHVAIHKFKSLWLRIPQIILRAIPRIAFFALLLVHVIAAQSTLAKLQKAEFVPSKRAAELIKQQLQKYPDAVIVCGNQVIATAVAAYLPGHPFYYPTMNRFGTYTVWTEELWGEASAVDILDFANKQKTPVIIIRCFSTTTVRGATKLQDFKQGVEPLEIFSVQLFLPQPKDSLALPVTRPTK